MTHDLTVRQREELKELIKEANEKEQQDETESFMYRVRGPASVADPGFPIGGAPTHWGGVPTSNAYTFLAKMYAKMKEIDPVGGGHAPAASPPWICQ